MEYDDYLEHYGVKGMKWGRRKGSLSSRVKEAGIEKKTQAIGQRERVLSGKSSLGDKVAAASTLSIPSILRNKGVKNSIAKDLARDKATLSRLQSGKATFADKLDTAMNVSVLDLAVKRVS